MASSGELYQRTDGKWAFRITASNGQIVATDGGRGYESKSGARDTLEKVIGGRYVRQAAPASLSNAATDCRW